MNDELGTHHNATVRPAIVIIKGIQVSNHFYEPLLEKFGAHELCLINLYDFVDLSQSQSIDELARRITNYLDDLQIHKAIFISTGIGNLISIKIGLKREDLTLGQVFTGTSNDQLDPDLLKVYEYALSFSMDCEEDELVRPLLKKLLADDLEKHQNHVEEEINMLLSVKAQRKMLILLKMRASQSFSTQDLLNYKIPNYIIAADGDPLAFEEDVLRFTQKLGSNRGLFFLQDFKSNLALIMSKSYLLTLDSIFKRFRDHYRYFSMNEESIRKQYVELL